MFIIDFNLYIYRKEYEQMWYQLRQKTHHMHCAHTHTIEVCLDGVGKLLLFGGYSSCTAWPCGPVASVMGLINGALLTKGGLFRPRRRHVLLPLNTTVMVCLGSAMIKHHYMDTKL